MALTKITQGVIKPNENYDTHNINSTGIITATQFHGDGSNLTGLADPSVLTFGGATKVEAVSTGATVTGDISATNAIFSGNLTVQGTTSTIDTIVTSVDSLTVEGNVGIGTTNATEILHIQTGTSDEITTFKVRTSGRIELSRNHASAPYIKTLMGSGNPNIILGDSVGDRVLINGNGSSYFNGGNVGIGTDNPATNFKLDVNGDLSLGEFGGSDNTYIDQKQNGSLEIINSGRDTNSGDIRINRTNNISGDTTYFRDFRVYDGKGTTLLFVDGSAASVGINSTAPTGTLDVGGNILPDADNTRDLGSSSKRWANIYTGDLNLSNEGAVNDVDGTWGQYTIQEGENDLFLINRRTGKKYKFNLTEVN